MDYYQKGAAASVQTMRMDSQLLKTLIFCSTLLGMKYMASVFATVIPNRIAGDVPVEDKPILEKVFGKDYDKKYYCSIKERFSRVVANDQEHVPVGLALLWMAGLVVSNATPSSDIATPDYVIQLTQLFTISRLAHSGFFYVGSSFRSFPFLGGLVASWGAGIVVLKGMAGL